MKTPIRYDKRRIGAKSIKKKSPLNSSFANQQKKEKYWKILYQASKDWDSLIEFREKARRCDRYRDGSQWDDLVKDPDTGCFIKEKELIKKQGRVPLVQNIIFGITQNIVGQYRSNSDKSTVLVRDPERTDEEPILTDILQAISEANQLSEIDTQVLRYYLSSGAIIQRASYRYMKQYDRSEVYIENIDYNRIFFNSDVKDLRMNDLCRIGMIHDLSLDELLSVFCHNKEDEEWMRDKFESSTSYPINNDGLTGKDMLNIDFIGSYDNTRMRVVESWVVETEWTIRIYDPATGSEGLTDLTEAQIKTINQKRKQEVLGWNAQNPDSAIPEEEIALIEYEKTIEPYWKVYYLLDDGTCLYEGKTPYEHQEHPFLIRCSPMTSGKVYGVIDPMIDPQRMINRTIMLWDFITGAGAKGVLLIPDDAIPDGMTPETFADEWTRFNGVIVYKPSTKHNHLPKQVTSNSVPAGLFDMLNTHLQLIQNISGVNGAIQGQAPKSGTSGTLYQQETQNAAINTLDIMKTMASYKEVRDRKVLQLAMQFYNGKRRIISSQPNGGIITVDPEKIRDIEFDTRVIQNQDTPAYRSLTEDRLVQMVMGGLLPPEIYFENSSDPTNKKIFESLKRYQQEATQNATVDPELMAMANQANPRAVELLNQAIMPGTPENAPEMVSGRTPIDTSEVIPQNYS